MYVCEVKGHEEDCSAVTAMVIAILILTHLDI